jgi:pimeloyl-ACP methyl ester carboxylesterase
VGRERSVNGADRLLALPWLGDVLSAAGLFALGRVLPGVGSLSAHLPGHAGAWLQASLPDRRYAAGMSQAGMRLWRSFVAEQRALLAEIGDVERAATGVRAPTVVVTGTWDVVVPPAVAAGLAGTVPGAELVLVARTGHFLPRDAPGVLAGAVRRAWARAGG